MNKSSKLAVLAIAGSLVVTPMAEANAGVLTSLYRIAVRIFVKPRPTTYVPRTPSRMSTSMPRLPNINAATIDDLIFRAEARMAAESKEMGRVIDLAVRQTGRFDDKAARIVAKRIRNDIGQVLEKVSENIDRRALMAVRHDREKMLEMLVESLKTVSGAQKKTGNPAYSFEVLSGKLVFNKTYRVGSGEVTLGEVNAYRMLLIFGVGTTCLVNCSDLLRDWLADTVSPIPVDTLKNQDREAPKIPATKKSKPVQIAGEPTLTTQ